MSTRSRSQDLTADLLHDLSADDTTAVVTPAAAAPAPSPFIETALLLAPRTWVRPGITRSGATVSLSAGPVRVRLGRR